MKSHGVNNNPGVLVLSPGHALEPATKALNTLCFGAALRNSDWIVLVGNH